MTNVFFEEDREILTKMESTDIVPEKGFEGWFHKHSPYSSNTNRVILILTAVTIFVVSLFFFLATIYNQNQISGQRSNSFIERSNNTNSN